MAEADAPPRKDCRTTAKDCNFCQRNLLTLLHAATVAPLFQKFPRPQKLAAPRCAGLRRVAPHCNFLARNSIDGFPLGWVRWFLLLFTHHVLGITHPSTRF